MIDISTYIKKEINWKKFTVNVILGYVISWVYFLGTLTYVQRIFGKANGTIINYGLSWAVWFIAFDALHTLNPSGDY